jgi:hypothetical protein
LRAGKFAFVRKMRHGFVLAVPMHAPPLADGARRIGMNMMAENYNRNNRLYKIDEMVKEVTRYKSEMIDTLYLRDYIGII